MLIDIKGYLTDVDSIEVVSPITTNDTGNIYSFEVRMHSGYTLFISCDKTEHRDPEEQMIIARKGIIDTLQEYHYGPTIN